MRRESPAQQRALLALMLVLAILLAVLATWFTWPSPLPPAEPIAAIESVVPETRKATAPAPGDVVDIDGDVEPTRPEHVAAPTPRTWRVGGAHMPECWPRDYEPRPLHPERTCQFGDRVEICTVGRVRLPDDIHVGSIDELLLEVERVLGMRRQGRLTVLLYSFKAYFAELERREMSYGVAGWFDGHVHVAVVPSDSRTREVLRHEMLHAVMGPAIGCAPRSVHEGVADWFDGDIHVNRWTHLLWRGHPYPGRSLDGLLTSNDRYEVGYGYAEASARVHHAVAVHGEEVVPTWLDQVRTGSLSSPAAAWAALDNTFPTPVMETLAEEYLNEAWTPELHARLQEHSLTCADLYDSVHSPPLLAYGHSAQDTSCVLLDRDPSDPDLPAPVAEALRNYEERWQQNIEINLQVHEELNLR